MTNRNDGTVSVITTATGAVSAPMTVGTGPIRVAICPSRSRPEAESESRLEVVAGEDHEGSERHGEEQQADVDEVDPPRRPRFGGSGSRAVHNREDARSGELLAFRVEK